jgi:hypothetical protein
VGVKRPGREADHSPPSIAEFKNAWSYTSTPQYAFMSRFSVKAQGKHYLLILIITTTTPTTIIAIKRWYNFTFMRDLWLSRR